MTVGLRSFACAAALSLAVAGCSHMAENRAIEAFSAALAGSDLTELEQSTSAGFRGKALRSAEALDDLEILRLPTGDVSIVSVEEDSETEKNVVVKVGESKTKLLYKLVKDDGKWVVDDIFVRQRRRGHVATRSVTEQMDLLLSVREFLDAWTEGNRDEVLAVTTPEFRAVLADLPPAYLASLTAGISGEEERSSRPDAQLDNDRALVTLPRTSGKLVVSFRQAEDESWKVSDLALESKSKEEAVASVLKRATALATAVKFLEAFNDGNKETLAAVTTKAFYENSLDPADLSSVKLPRAVDAAGVHDLTVEAHRADFVIPSETEVVKVALVRAGEEDARGLPPVYRVEEATIYEVDGGQEKRLSALFTAHASMQVFAEALRERNLPILRHTSTSDFNHRVWDRLVDRGLDGFPLVDVAPAAPTIVNTVFQGAVTEITVTQGPRAMTYVLRGRNADLRVDDVLVPATGRPASMKTTLEHVVPGFLLARGLEENDLSMVRRSCSDDFNRLVWSQLRSIPQMAQEAPRYLATPPTSVTAGDERSLVTLGGDRTGAKLALVRERGFWVVDELQLIAGPLPEERVALKDRLRSEVARRVAEREPAVPPNRVTMSGAPLTPKRSTAPAVDPLDAGLADAPIGADLADSAIGTTAAPSTERPIPSRSLRTGAMPGMTNPTRTAAARPVRTDPGTITFTPEVKPASFDEIADRPIE